MDEQKKEQEAQLTPEQVASQVGGTIVKDEALPISAPAPTGAAINNSSFDEGFERPPSNWIKWGKLQDVIKGTYIGQFNKKNADGSSQAVYEIEVEAGSYHNIKEVPADSRNYVVDEKATELVVGEIYNVGGKKIIDNAMRRARIGQRVLMRYVGNFMTPAGNAKTVEVKLGSMNDNFANKENAQEDIKVEDIPFN